MWAMCTNVHSAYNVNSVRIVDTQRYSYWAMSGDDGDAVPAPVLARAVIEDRNKHGEGASRLTRARVHRVLFLLNNLFAFATDEPLFSNPMIVSASGAVFPDSYQRVYTTGLESPVVDAIISHRPEDDMTCRLIMGAVLDEDEYAGSTRRLETVMDRRHGKIISRVIRGLSRVPDAQLNRNDPSGAVYASRDTLTAAYHDDGTINNATPPAHNSAYTITREALTGTLEPIMEPWLTLFA